MHDDTNHKRASESEDDYSDVPAMALGALDTTDEDAATRELRDSSRARAELRDLEEVVGDLGLATPKADVSPALRDRILAATAPQTEPISLADERQSRAPVFSWAGYAAAAVLILVLGIFAFSQWTTASDRGEQIDNLEAQLAVQDEQIALLEQAAESAGAFVNFEQPLIWTELAATTEGGEPPGYLARTPDGSAAYLLLTGVEVDAEHVFQAWLIEDAPVPVGTLRPSEDGLGFLILEHSGEPVQDFSLIGVTIEPPGGSPQPTSDPIIVAEIV